MLFAWWFTIISLYCHHVFTTWWSSLTSRSPRKVVQQTPPLSPSTPGAKDMKKMEHDRKQVVSPLVAVCLFFGPWWICILNICFVFSSKLSWFTCFKILCICFWMFWFSIVVTHFECSCPLPTWHMPSSLGTCVHIDVHNMIILSYTRPKRLIYYISYIIIHTLKESIVTYYVAIWYLLGWS